MKSFNSIKYIGGLPQLTKPQTITVTVNNKLRRLIFDPGFGTPAYINFEDIDDISLDEKSSRSAGRAATGAIVGGLLTGGIGLIAGGAIGARKKNRSILYITYKKGEKTLDVLLRPQGQTEKLYASISSAIASDPPSWFDFARTPPPPPKRIHKKEKKEEIAIRVFATVLIIIVIVYLLSCNK